MTNREFFNAIINAEVSNELKEFATESIKKLDAKNARRSSQPSKTAIANEPIKKQIVEFLDGKAIVIASEIASALEISTQKVSALCRQLIEDGILLSEEVKTKKGKVKGYRLKEWD